jgi:CheY-like chemotaxis protein
MLTSLAERTQPVARPHVLRTVIVVGQPGQELPDSALETIDYDIVVLEPMAHAYSQIKRVQPMLVLITMSFDDMQGCQLMSMLRLDPETASIPIRAYAAVPVEADDEPDEMDDFAQSAQSALPN